jgi:phosphopantothenoylcysteine decarboxylase/phosphopantothenate--cysteine ligase
MTRNACRFVSPLTFAALSGRKVITGMFEEPGREANIESAIEHMAVAQAAELLLIAPATANLLGKMARGIADDFLTTLYLATKAPVVVAPAMNVNMWEHPAVRENVARLRERGVRVVEPEEGYLACGMTGAGRLASLDAILAAALEVLGLRRDLQDETVLVTAGPTQEPIDPVRFISNRSSGKMGYAIAAAAARRGARTLLISGPTSLPPPDGVEFVDVQTAEQMAQAVLARLEDATIVIKAAAVADYRPVTAAPQKIKKCGGKLSLDLEPATDILAEVGRRKGRRLVVGFSAETEHLQANARKKLEEKNVDLMVANDVTQGVFDSDYNTAVLITRQGATELPRMTKAELAGRILDAVVALRAEGRARTETGRR